MPNDKTVSPKNVDQVNTKPKTSLALADTQAQADSKPEVLEKKVRRKLGNSGGKGG